MRAAASAVDSEVASIEANLAPSRHKDAVVRGGVPGRREPTFPKLRSFSVRELAQRISRDALAADRAQRRPEHVEERAGRHPDIALGEGSAQCGFGIDGGCRRGQGSRLLTT